MNLASLIDHTNLNPDATGKHIQLLCAQALAHEFKAVCINPVWVTQARKYLADSSCELCTVIGFPLGACPSTTKCFEARQAIDAGATELDMVINIGALKEQRHEQVQDDIAAVVESAQGQATVKVILECALLDRSEKVSACELALRAGADYVKTSTGFVAGKATVQDVSLMASVVDHQMGIKAAGGIRDRETAERLVAAGATRLGTSSSLVIIQSSHD
jgi:deoxyribose-phosphate aldolase